MLAQLYTGDVRITQGYLEENGRILKLEWFPNQPIEAPFDQIEDAHGGG